MVAIFYPPPGLCVLHVAEKNRIAIEVDTFYFGNFLFMEVNLNTRNRILKCGIIPFLFVCLSFTVQGQTATIVGKVVTVEERVPLSNVSIEIVGRAGRVSTNEKGLFEIHNLTAGTYTMTVNRVGFKPTKTTVTVGEGSVNVDIVLHPDPIGMNEVIISGYRESYTTGDNFSASRINASMMTLPLSTGQVTNKLITDQNSLNMNDALRNVSGVVTEFGGPHPLIVNIRGFNASVFKDGFRVGGCNNLSAGGDDLPISAIAVDRIEVLKGPSTILYGRGEPGGIVNFISKQPQADPGYAIETSVGSFQQYRVGGSATGPLLNQEAVSYRLDGSYEQGNSYRDVVKTNTYFVKPSFAIKASENTKVYLTAEAARSEFTPDRGVLMLPSMSPTGVLSGAFAPISSRSHYFGDAADHTDQKQQRAVLEVEHAITSDWTIRVGANYERAQQQSAYVLDWFYSFGGASLPFFPPGSVPPNWSVRLRDVMDSKRNDFGTRVENYVRLRHSLFNGEIEHKILVVADVLQIDTRYTQDHNPYELMDPSTGMRINLNNPSIFSEEIAANSKDYGFSVQDLITIDSRWHLLLGGRIEKNTVDVTQLAAFTTAPTSTNNNSSGFAPRLGILYQLNDNLSLYASYMGSYQSPGADYGLWDIPADLKPERAYQTEAGVKVELLNKRALLTASVFMIDKYDVISSEMNPARVSPYTLYYNIGKEDAQGVELDVVGEVSSNIRVTAAFNTQTMKFTNPKKLVVDGKQRYGTPTYSGNLWALYEFSDGMVNGLGIGGGATMKSEVYVNDANEAKVPAFTTIDAVAYYEFSNLRLQLNVNNITNVLAYTVSNIGGFGNPTSPFLVMPISPMRMNFTVRYQLR